MVDASTHPVFFFFYYQFLFFFYDFSPRFFTFVFYFIIRPADDPSLSVSLEQCNDNTAKHVEISLSIFFNSTPSRIILRKKAKRKKKLLPNSRATGETSKSREKFVISFFRQVSSPYETPFRNRSRSNPCWGRNVGDEIRKRRTRETFSSRLIHKRWTGDPRANQKFV